MLYEGKMPSPLSRASVAVYSLAFSSCAGANANARSTTSLCARRLGIETQLFHVRFLHAVPVLQRRGHIAHQVVDRACKIQRICIVWIDTQATPQPGDRLCISLLLKLNAGQLDCKPLLRRAHAPAFHQRRTRFIPPLQMPERHAEFEGLVAGAPAFRLRPPHHLIPVMRTVGPIRRRLVATARSTLRRRQSGRDTCTQKNDQRDCADAGTARSSQL